MQQERQPTATMEPAADLLTEFDLHLFREGTHYRLFDKLGAHLTRRDGLAGVHFAVWAPNAREVSVCGDFNQWSREANPLARCADSGIWAGFVPGAGAGSRYQYHIVSWHHEYRVDKADPVGFRHGPWPPCASEVWDLAYQWSDADWRRRQPQLVRTDLPLAIYELDLGSWRRVPEEGNRPLTYRELAPYLADYVSRQGFTHVEFLPVMEHAPEHRQAFDVAGYFAPCSRFGTPQDLMFMIEYLHQRNIGVIFDWVPAWFFPHPCGLAYFDGTHLYEHGFWELALPDESRGYTFELGRPEVRSFLISSAIFWLDRYHADGLRLGPLEPLLYLDFARRPGEWVPNPHGGRENLDAIEFLRQLNTEVERCFPAAQMFAAETTGWPLVSHPAATGGLGFTCKWDEKGVRHALEYLGHDPFFRKHHHDLPTRRGGFALDENLVLPLSHALQSPPDRRSLLERMPGDEWQRFANLRLLFGYLYLQPGKKLVFMGDDFGQWLPWNPQASLDWHLCAYPRHAGLQQWVRDLNQLYRREPALHQSDTAAAGFDWVNTGDAEQSTLSWLRRDPGRREVILAVCNFTPVARRNFRAGVRRAGTWRELLNSDAKEYGGSGQGNFGGVASVPFGSDGLPHTLTFTLPPLAVVVFKHEGNSA